MKVGSSVRCLDCFRFERRGTQFAIEWWILGLRIAVCVVGFRRTICWRSTRVLVYLCIFCALACSSSEAPPAEKPAPAKAEVKEKADPPAADKDAAAGIPTRLVGGNLATRGQLSVILQRSNILKNLGFNPTFVGTFVWRSSQ